MIVLRQVIGDELRVEQDIAAGDQPRHEIDQADLRGVGRPAEHAFAEERRPQADPVEPADDLAVLPRLDGVAVAEFEQIITALEFGADELVALLAKHIAPSGDDAA